MNYDRNEFLDAARRSLNSLQNDISRVGNVIGSMNSLKWDFNLERDTLYKNRQSLKITVDETQKEIWRNNDAIRFNQTAIANCRPPFIEKRWDNERQCYYEVEFDPDKHKREACEAKVEMLQSQNGVLQAKVDEASEELEAVEENIKWLDNAIKTLEGYVSDCESLSASVGREQSNIECRVKDASRVLDEIQELSFDKSHELSFGESMCYQTQWVDGQVDVNVIERVVDEFYRQSKNMIRDFETFLKSMKNVGDWDDDLKVHFFTIIQNIAKIFDKYIFSSVESNMKVLNEYKDLVDKYERIIKSM